MLIQIALGLLYGNFLEWSLHNTLHKMGKTKINNLSFHWEHHRNVRKNDYYDSNYEQTVFNNFSNFREALSLLAATIIHLPLLYFFPIFFLTTFLYMFVYYYVHSRSHLYPEWGKKYFRWHYDHHMNYQNNNWCVTLPLFDFVFGTYKKPPETDKETRDEY